MRNLLIIGVLVAPFAVGTGLAQTTAPSAQNPPAKTASTKARSAVSAECTKRANEQNLHGPARKKFRASCKKELEKKG